MNEVTETPAGSRLGRAASAFWMNWVRPFILIALVVGSLRSALADWNDVPTGSMKPTILEGDRVVVNKLAYDLKIPFTTMHIAQWDDPARGDIVVFFSPVDGKRFVKRVIGLPGDTIEARREALLINGRPAHYGRSRLHLQPRAGDLPHVLYEEQLEGASHPIMLSPDNPSIRNFGPYLVPAGCYFVMGDNRDNSFDSRYFGCVPRDRIIGRAAAVAFSLDRDRHLTPRWERFLSWL
ncbi:MAG TPA: signal peptidase I [Thermoanaerobaculia bacterium]|nr:signal peptidase I [Thermoanaerobaculia bacterium]